MAGSLFARNSDEYLLRITYIPADYGRTAEGVAVEINDQNITRVFFLLSDCKEFGNTTMEVGGQITEKMAKYALYSAKEWITREIWQIRSAPHTAQAIPKT